MYCGSVVPGFAGVSAGTLDARTLASARYLDSVLDVRVLGAADNLNTSLEKVGRVADFFELAELKARDSLERNESCGGHFRTESQTPEGEALRDDENYAHVSAWEWGGTSDSAVLHKEEFTFDNVPLTQRSYK